MEANKVTRVCNENMCAGCRACEDMCPKSAITICDNVDSFDAVIDMDACVNCNLCKKICQANNAPKLNAPISWYQGWAEDGIRAGSSSGGFASAIIKSFDGVVCSCVFRDGQFVFEFDEGDRAKYAGSKYVKSNPAGVYGAIKERLLKGERVLFLGLPCQCAALRNVTGGHDSLYLIDLICHGTPSPKVLNQYLSEAGVDILSADNIRFRCKPDEDAPDYKRTEPNRVKDFYTHAFLSGLSYTENCYECQYARLERVSDLTLGDSWENELGDDQEKKGVSLVLCQSAKGQELLDNAGLTLKEVDLEKAVAGNTQLRHPAIKPDNRSQFFAGLQKSFDEAIKRSDKAYYRKYKQKKLLIRLGLMDGKPLGSRFGISYKGK